MEGIYFLLNHWDISIERGHTFGESRGGILERDPEKRKVTVFVDICQNPEEKIITLLHELLHLTPENASDPSKPNSELESRLDRRAYDILYSQKGLVNYVTERFNLGLKTAPGRT